MHAASVCDARARAQTCEPSMFVLLEHDTTDAVGVPAPEHGRHWDLLIEAPGSERLPTWRLARDPRTAAGEIPAERIGDHRRVYLEFEGEISGGRGIVRRVERGLATIARLAGDELTVTLDGLRLRGRFEIVRSQCGQTVFRRAADDATRTFAS